MKTITEKGVKFLLKDARSTEPTLIYLVFRYNNGRFKASTGQTIAPHLWDAARQEAITDPKQIRVKRVREANETLNTHLKRQRSALLKVLNSLHLAGDGLDNETIRHHLDKELGRGKPVAGKPVKEPFIAYITRFVEEAKAGKRLNAKNARFAPGTLGNYTKIKNILTAYQTEIGRALDYPQYNLAFYDSFKKYLTAKGYTLNYIGAVLNGIKMLLKYAYRDGLHQSTDFQQREFRKIEEDVDSVYLTSAELQELYGLDLSGNKRLDRVRDLFLIGCYTGLRFSDYSQLRPENLTSGGRILTVTTQKTGAKVSIPLNPNVLSILSKYNGVPPRSMSNQKFNDYLKEIGEMAKLTEPVQKTRTRGGFRATETVEKWKVITSHTARRSFATNAFLAGVPPVSIMKITGHKSEGQFLKYIKVSSEQNALLLLNHPHFKIGDMKNKVQGTIK